MHKARAFFFVCAGIFLLALAFQLGHVTAHAQGGTALEGACIESFELNAFPRATVCVNRWFYWMGENGTLHQLSVPVPGTLRIVATDPYQTVMLESGDWLKFTGSSWVLVGNLAGGPTPAAQTTWGQLKAKYATPRAARTATPAPAQVRR